MCIKYTATDEWIVIEVMVIDTACFSDHEFEVPISWLRLHFSDMTRHNLVRRGPNTGKHIIINVPPKTGQLEKTKWRRRVKKQLHQIFNSPKGSTIPNRKSVSTFSMSRYYHRCLISESPNRSHLCTMQRLEPLKGTYRDHPPSRSPLSSDP